MIGADKNCSIALWAPPAPRPGPCRLPASPQRPRLLLTSGPGSAELLPLRASDPEQPHAPPPPAMCALQRRLPNLHPTPCRRRLQPEAGLGLPWRTSGTKRCGARRRTTIRRRAKGEGAAAARKSNATRRPHFESSCAAHGIVFPALLLLLGLAFNQNVSLRAAVHSHRTCPPAMSSSSSAVLQADWPFESMTATDCMPPLTAGPATQSRAALLPHRRIARHAAALRPAGQ